VIYKLKWSMYPLLHKLTDYRRKVGWSSTRSCRNHLNYLLHIRVKYIWKERINYSSEYSKCGVHTIPSYPWLRTKKKMVSWQLVMAISHKHLLSFVFILKSRVINLDNFQEPYFCRKCASHGNRILFKNMGKNMLK